MKICINCGEDEKLILTNDDFDVSNLLNIYFEDDNGEAMCETIDFAVPIDELYSAMTAFEAQRKSRREEEKE